MQKVFPDRKRGKERGAEVADSLSGTLFPGLGQTLCQKSYPSLLPHMFFENVLTDFY